MNRPGAGERFVTKSTTHIGVLSLELFIPLSGSLKSKRRVLKSLKDRVRNTFNASVAEVGEMEKWQKAVCAIGMVGNDKSYLDSCLQKILLFIEAVHDVEIISHEVEFL